MEKIKKDYTTYIIGFLAIIVSLFLHNIGLYSLVETKLYDYRFQLRGPLSSFKSDVVLVEIDDESYRLLDEPYPYPRGRIWSKVVRNLTKAGAKVIAFDIQFDSKDHEGHKIFNNKNSFDYHDGDLEFSKSIDFANQNDTKIVLASKIGYEQSRLDPYYIVKPIPILEKRSYTGLIDHEVDEIDNFSRRYTIFNSLPGDTTKYFSFGLQTVMCFFDIDPNAQIIQNVRENKIVIDRLIITPYRGEASFLVNYYGPTSNTYNTFPVYSLSNIVDDLDYDLRNLNEDQNWIDMFINTKHLLYKNFGIEKSPFKDKIVIIGSSLKEDHDFTQTPFFSYNDNENPIPGLEFHANAIQQLIHSNYIIVPTKTLDLNSESFIYHMIIIIFLVLVVLLLSKRLNIFQSMFSIILFSLLWFSISIGLFINDQFWIIKLIINFCLGSNYSIRLSGIDDTLYLVPVFYPISTIFITYGMNLLYNVVKEQRDKNFLKETFGRYISPELIDEMYKAKKIPELGGESGIRTAFFSDIESFTVIAENLSAVELVNVLNEFLDMGEHTISIEMPNPPFGLALVTLKLEVTNSEGELINSNENQLFLITAFDFEMIENLGSTNELGLFELTSSYHKWIPTFYPPVEMNSTDEFGSVLGTHTQYDLVDNFEIIFLKDGIYKTFDIDLKDGDYDYSFEWNDGEIFN